VPSVGSGYFSSGQIDKDHLKQTIQQVCFFAQEVRTTLEKSYVCGHLEYHTVNGVEFSWSGRVMAFHARGETVKEEAPKKCAGSEAT
jgi:hypothetical protein